MDLDNNVIEKYRKAYCKIKKAKNILFVSHERPDGDAFSSICAMIEFSKKFGKKYTAYCYGELVQNFYYLSNVEKIIYNKSLIKFIDYDLIIILDCGSKSRTNLEKEIKAKNKDQYIIEFDHHPKVEDYSNLEIRNSSAVSTTEILYYFFKVNKIKINKNIANCILTGILTDTGNFLYQSTSEKAVNITSEMLSLGASFSKIIKNILHNKSLSAMKLWGKALSGLKINKKYDLGFTVLEKKDLDSFQNEEALESFAGFLSNLNDVKGVIFLRAIGSDKIKGSLRSSYANIDISKLAVVLGGGGHSKASGFVINGSLTNKNGKWKIV